MTITDHASQAAANLRSAWNTADIIRLNPNAEIEHRLATAAVQAQLATAAAIDRLTAAVQHFADYVITTDQNAAAEVNALSDDEIQGDIDRMLATAAGHQKAQG